MKRYCITCGKPLRLPGAQCIPCGLRNLDLAIAGWVFYGLGRIPKPYLEIELAVQKVVLKREILRIMKRRKANPDLGIAGLFCRVFGYFIPAIEDTWDEIKNERRVRDV